MIKPAIKTLFILAFIASISSSCVAVENDNASTGRDFGYGNMEAYRFKKGTFSLLVSDINGDGLDDVIFLNNQASRLEILLRKKEKDTGDKKNGLGRCFTDAGFVIDQFGKRVIIADLDQDGKKDILLIGRPLGPQIFFQLEDGVFDKPRKIHLENGEDLTNAVAADLDGKKGLEVLLGKTDGLEIFSIKSRNKFEPFKKLPFSSDRCSYFDCLDLTGNGVLDLFLYYKGLKAPFTVRQGKGNGKFAWEQSLESTPMSTFRPFHNPKSKGELGIILKNHKVFRLFQLESEKRKQILRNDEVAPLTLPLRGVGKKKSGYLLTDVNGDDFADICVAAPKLSQLHIYLGSKNGFASEPLEINTLAGVSEILRGANNDLIVFSAKEKALARHSLSDLDKFPKNIACDGEPVAIARLDDSFCFLTKDPKSGKFTLKACVWDSDGKIKILKSFEVDLKNPPSAMMAYHLTKKEPGIIFFTSYQKPDFYRIDGDKLKKLNSARLSSLSSDTKCEMILPLKGKDGDNLVICGGNVAREYDYHDGDFEIVRQFNPATQNSRLVAISSFKREGEEGLIFYDDSMLNLLWFARNSQKPGAKARLLDGVANLRGMNSFKVNGGDGLFMIGKGLFAVLEPKQKTLEMKQIGEYVSKAEEVSYWNFRKILVGDKEKPMIALFDRKNRTLEIIEDAEGNLRPKMVFEVYKPREMFMVNKMESEPHGLKSGDLNGDGIQDLALLVHDRLLIYLGEK